MEETVAGAPPVGRKRMVALIGSTVMLVGGIGLVVLFFGQPARRSWRARSWEPASCTIVNSRLDRGGGGAYRVQATYIYNFGGIVYTGTRADFEEGFSSRHSTQRGLDRLVPGRSVACWVNPRNPDQVVLDRGIARDSWFGLIPTIFALLGALGLYGSFRPRPT